MKRIVSVLLFFVFAICLITTFNIITLKKRNIDKLLAPYQGVIIKVNLETGSKNFIPDSRKEKFYNIVKNMTPKEYEKLLRNSSEAYILKTDSHEEYKAFTTSNPETSILNKSEFSTMPCPGDIPIKIIKLD